VRISLYDYCTDQGRTELLDQWDPVANGALTPADLTYGSRQKVWWRCPQGHTWQAAVYTRTGSETGCPYCAGKRVAPGDNDLATGRPDLAAQWHPTKNQGLTPADVCPGSHKMVWWVCSRGHMWRASIHSRVKGNGCPVCAGRTIQVGVNDLASAFPELARQWHPTRNGGLTPRDVTCGSHKKVWWQCDRGHQWQAMPLSRVHGSGCPVCAGKVILPGENDLASAFPAIAAQWHPTKNGNLTPDQVAPASNRRVWWRCNLGHAYLALVSQRTGSSSGCPYCAGRRVLPGFNDLATVEPRVAAQWHPELNGALTAEQVTAGSHKKVWWQCPEGHVWKAEINSRAGVQKCGCPVCAGKVKPPRAPGYAPPYQSDTGGCI
jgi:hypothetical protein